MCPGICPGLKRHPREPFPQWRGRLSSRPCGPLRACLRTVGLGSHWYQPPFDGLSISQAPGFVNPFLKKTFFKNF